MRRRAQFTLSVCVLLAACGTRGKSPAAGSLDRLTTQSGLTMPASATVLFEETDPRATSEGYGMWIVSAKEEFRPPGDEVTVPAETVRKVLETHVELERPRTPEQARSYRWTNGGAAWRASLLKTGSSYHLIVERSKQ